MLIVMKKSATEPELDRIKEYLIDKDFHINQSTGTSRTIIGVIGETETLDLTELEEMGGVLQVIRIEKED